MTSLPLRILVVDDDAAGRRGLALVLGRDGHAVEICPSGPAALESLRAARADVLLTDYQMPSMTGLELVAAARAIDPALRCFVMSGHLRDDSVPADIAWVEKPVDLTKLLAILAAD